MRYTPTDITSTYASIAALNQNFEDIQTLLEKCVFRDGTSPNSMLANLDLNHFTINNLGAPANPADAVRLQDISAVLGTLDTDMATLAGSGGAALIGSQAAGTGSVARTVQAKLRDAISVADFGAVGDGVTDDTAKIQAAIDSLSTFGGQVLIPYAFRCRVASDLTVKPNVSIVTSQTWTGRSTVVFGTNTDYTLMGGCIRLASTATIRLKGGASLNGVLVYRYGMTFPASDASGFAGTAVTIEGDDAAVSRCFVMGFNKAIICTAGATRPRIDFLLFDCVNGIEISNCGDVPYVSNCHANNFATAASGAAHTSFERTGIAYYIHDSVDWAKLTNCFAFGYARGFKIENTNSTQLIGCGADDTFATIPLHSGSIGFEITGSADTRLIGCQSAAHGQAGIYVNNTAGLCTYIEGGLLQNNGNHAILVDSGDLHVDGTLIRDTGTGISVTNNTSNVFISDSVRFERVTTVLNPSVSTSKIKMPVADLATLADGTAPASGNMILPTLASAGALQLPANRETFNVSGTTNITTLVGGHAGRTVTFIFAGILTVSNATGTTSSIRLAGATNFTTAVGSTLTLRHNGVQWYEISRAA